MKLPLYLIETHLEKHYIVRPAGEGLTSWLSFVASNCEFVMFPLVSWVIVSIPDLCTLNYYNVS